MVRFIVRRLAYTVVALLGATLLVFMLSRTLGDPLTLYAQGGGYGLTPEMYERLRKELHLDKHPIVQYGYWLRDVGRGRLGESLLGRQPVSKLLRERTPNTLKLGLAAWVFSIVVGVPLGVLSAVRRASGWDYLGRGFALLGQAAPPFWVGIMGILVFAVHLRWLPVGTMGEGLAVRHFIMPTVTLGWLAAASYLRLTRSAMLEVLDSEYVKFARAKGVGRWVVVWKHAFRNALIPPLTLSALVLAGFITGTVVVETVFSWPGLGRLAVEAVWNNDFPVMTGCVLLFTAMYLGVNLLTDIAYAYIDPRIRYQ